MIVNGRTASVATTVAQEEKKAIASTSAVSASWLVTIQHNSGDIRQSIVDAWHHLSDVDYSASNVTSSNISALASAELSDSKITLFVENRSEDTVTIHAHLLYQ